MKCCRKLLKHTLLIVFNIIYTYHNSIKNKKNKKNKNNKNND